MSNAWWDAPRDEENPPPIHRVRVEEILAQGRRIIAANATKETAKEMAEELRQDELREQGQSRVRNGEVVVVNHEYYQGFPSFIGVHIAGSLMGVWGVRKLARFFGRDISRRQAYGLLVAATAIGNRVTPDRRAMPRHTAKKFDDFGKRLAKRFE